MLPFLGHQPSMEFTFDCSFQEFYFGNKQKVPGKGSWIEELEKKNHVKQEKKKNYLIWRLFKLVNVRDNHQE